MSWPDIVRGLVRPFISVSFTLATIALALTGSVEPREILTVTGVIVAFHFGERSARKNDA